MGRTLLIRRARFGGVFLLAGLAMAAMPMTDNQIPTVATTVTYHRPPEALQAAVSLPIRVRRGIVHPAHQDILLKIARCESGNNPRAVNRRSGAAGVFQDLPSTWHHWRGYPQASDAPVEVQWEFNRELYRRRGTQPWNSSRACWSRG